MKIQVEIKKVYGNEVVYPVCEIAKNLAILTGKKTLTKDALRTIKILGYETEVITPSLAI